MTNAEVSSELSLEKIQQKIVNVMGTPSEVWKAIEDVKNESSGEMTLSLEKVATNLDNSVLFLGQAFQSTADHRRYNVISSFMKDHKKLKETLRKKFELLGTKHCMLFREKF